MPCGYCTDRTKRILLMTLKICGELALLGAIASVFVVAAQGWAEEEAAEEAAAREYMVLLDSKMSEAKNKMFLARWDYDSNLTSYNNDRAVEAELEYSVIFKQYWKETMTYLWREFPDHDLKRQFQKYSILGTAALPEDLNERLLQAISNMKSTYAKATICDYHDKTKCDLHVEPEVTDIFASSSDPYELQHAWVQWHDAAGAPSKKDFAEYVALYNEAAKLNGYESVAEEWLSEYEDAYIESKFADLWEQVLPLYKELHAYVRRHLRLRYGDDIVPAKGPIPAHLLGNIWAQSWNKLESISKPYPDAIEVDVTAELIRQNYTALKMFEMAEDFFKSLNLSGMPQTFWERSIIEKPNDGRDLVCHASAWDFYDGNDFRIKQCTSITSDFFKTTHHEMGHIQYYIQYKDQPVIYRRGANPGFHEAVGDVIALSVASLKHLRKVGLLEEGPNDYGSMINQLYKMSLEKIAFLPFSYSLELFRYSVFRGFTSSEDYNCHYWHLKEIIQGIAPPVERTERDFDAAAKYHVSSDTEYSRYYVAFIIQFQFHRSLCLLANEYAPGDANKTLVDCDIYNSTAAGNALGQMLRMGSSKPWPEAMEALTGHRYMDAGGLLEYFQPLYEWLKLENERNGEFIGWEASTVSYCSAEQKAELPDSEFLKMVNKRL